jgi:DNA-binding SARP family transcriptional activator
MKTQALDKRDLAGEPQEVKPEQQGRSSLVVAAHPKLLRLIRSAQDVPCFICAPRKTGRSSLALDYAQRNHRLDQVLWIDGTSDNFAKALKSNALLEHLEHLITCSVSRYKLVVLDDMPFLEEQVASRFSDWIDSLVLNGVKVILITTPQDDCMVDYQSDRLLIDGKLLVSSQRWQKQRLNETLEQFFATPLPRELQSLAVLMLLMGRGIVDNFRELDYQIPAGLHVLLTKFCPLFEIDEETGYFDTTRFSLTEFTHHIPELLLEAPHKDESEQDSGLERCFERLTQLSLHLFERSESEQSQRILELIGTLLMAPEGEGIDDAMIPGTQTRTSLRQFAGYSFGNEMIPSLPKKQDDVLIVRLFGDFEILRGGQKVDGPELHRRKVRQLLIHLVLNMGRGLARDAIMEKLWPGKDYAHAKANFYATWSRLGRTLAQGTEGISYISNNNGFCRLEIESVLTDVLEFEQLSKFILFEEGSVEQRIEAVFRLDQVYRGDLLSGYLGDQYVIAAQQRYRSMLVDVMIAASRLFSREGNDTNAVWFARKAYDTDSTREDVYRTLMAMQDKAGQRTSALRTYFDCKQFLSDELGILPSQKTTALYQELILDRR